MAMTPVCCATCWISSLSASVSAIGISISTCLPARIVSIACLACTCVGLARIIASSPGCLRLSVRLVVQCGIFHFLATSSVPAGRPPAKVITSMPGIAWIASRCLMPKAPWPARPTFMAILSYPTLMRVFENEMTHRRVRGGHGVEAVHLLHLIVERAARDQPHHQLDAFRAGLADVIDMRDL